MEPNTYLLMKAGIDFEHALKHFDGCAFDFGDALLATSNDPIFERIARSYTPQSFGALYACASRLKMVADNWGMADVYESASILSEVTRHGGYSASSVGTAHTVLIKVVESTLCGIREACA